MLKDRSIALIGNCLQGVVAPVYRKNGFFSAKLILDWSKIVGEQYAEECCPLRISGVHPHCCLHIGASRSAAAQLVYVVPQLLERIRQYFGRVVVEEVRFVDCVAIPKPVKKKAVPTPVIVASGLVAYPPLDAALQRLNFAIQQEQCPQKVWSVTALN
jgi:hypothetical protein